MTVRFIHGLSALVLVALAPEAAARDWLEVTAEFGVGIPCNKFVNANGKEGDSHVRVSNSPGFSLQTSLLLNSFDFHYGMSSLPIKEFDLRIPDNMLAAAAQQGLNLDKQYSGKLDANLVFHELTFGYRIYVYRNGGWRIFLPNGLGPAIVTGGGVSRSLFGASATLGVGADWAFIPGFPYVLANVTARYNFFITETSQELVGIGYLTS